MNRQCSIGYHDECSDPNGYECDCDCHGYMDKLESAATVVVTLFEQGNTDLLAGAVNHLKGVLDSSPFYELS